MKFLNSCPSSTTISYSAISTVFCFLIPAYIRNKQRLFRLLTCLNPSGLDPLPVGVHFRFGPTFGWGLLPVGGPIPVGVHFWLGPKLEEGLNQKQAQTKSGTKLKVRLKKPPKNATKSCCIVA